MAELASGAVSSLLGLLQKEARLLDGVGKDVAFIREEMQSMNSFLEHLSMTAHLTGGHNKQVRTWMKQVRDLAHDCSNCVDYYLRSGDLAVHRARGGLRRYAWWTYWLVRKMVAQHRAAMQLRELKDRVSDVGKRRLRYGVEIPGKAAWGSSPTAAQTLASSTPSRGAAEDEDDDDDPLAQVASIAGASDTRRRALEPRTLEDFCAEKLLDRKKSSRPQETRQQGRYLIPSIGIIAPDADTSAAAAQGAMNFAATCFQKCVSINLKALHHEWDLPLLPQEILCYILREFKKQSRGQGKLEEKNNGEAEEAYQHRINTYNELWWDPIAKIENIEKKNEEILRRIGEVVQSLIAEVSSIKTEETKGSKATTGITKERPNMTGRSLEQIMQEEAKKLWQHMETVMSELPIRLDDTQYQYILQKVFPDSKSPQAQEIGNNTASTLGNNHIKEILDLYRTTLDNQMIALNNIRELLPSRPQLLGEHSLKEQAKGVLEGSQDIYSATDGAIKETKKKMDETSGEIKENSTTSTSKEIKEKVQEIVNQIIRSMFIKGIVGKINLLLESKSTLIILIDDSDYISQWEDIRDALSLLGFTNGSAVVVITKNRGKAKEFCCTPGEPINCSTVGLYHGMVLGITSQRDNEGGITRSQILHDILDTCDPNEFCMRVFAHALYANPNRSDEELHRLHGALEFAKKSVTANATIAKIILKFSYRDLPREYKTCLLYLAIFPEGHSVRRSTLIERWAVEGLIIKEDWPSIVRHAKRCFEALLGRWLVMPVDVSSAGRVKSCMVDGKVHEFITKIANKEHILDARLSQLRARHFSTSSGLRLRASDSINTVIVERLPKYLHKLRLLKLLDLEGCHGLEKKHLKDICNNILQLKYLSLRTTYIADLPSEINNLHELEVLDIRETNIPEHATRGIVLLKLRRLLAGSMDSSKILKDNKPLRSAVQIPQKIKKMDNIEVLTNVMAYSKGGAELKEIRNLGHLRKLGVVISNNKAHLKNLLWAVSDLKECIQSLSITILQTRNEGTPSNEELLPHDLYSHLIKPPKVLESLSLDGSTDIVQLLTLFAKGSDELEKVTLRRTLLEKKYLIRIIAMLPKLHCIRLRYDAYKEKNLTFEKDEFPHLKNFLVECLDKTDMINFESGAAPELEKIMLFSTDIKLLRGVGALPKLKELELKGNKNLLLSPRDGAASAQPIMPEDGRASAKPIISEDGIASAEKIVRTASAEPTLPEDGTAPAEPIAPTNCGTTSTETTAERTLSFKKEEYQRLKYFLMEGPSTHTNVIFEGGAPELEKIVLSGTNINSLVGASGLAKLRDLLEG